MKHTLSMLPLIGYLLLFTLSGCRQTTQEPRFSTAVGIEDIMDTIVRNDAGGYEFEPLAGYEVSVYEGSVTQYPSESDPYSGPGMVMFTTAFDQPVNLDHVIQLTRKANSAYTFTESTSINVGGIQGAMLEYTTEYHAIDGVIQDYYGAEEGETIHGRIVLVLRSPQNLYQCEMLAPDRQWKDMLPLYEDVLDSLRFFEPVSQ